MAEFQDSDGRPSKRARLDETATQEPSAEPTIASTTEPQSPTAKAQIVADAAMDNDLEREVRAGITEYVCPENLGFTGILKQRYTDFLVNEIGVDGKVVHLVKVGMEKEEETRKKDKRETAMVVDSDKKHGSVDIQNVDDAQTETTTEVKIDVENRQTDGNVKALVEAKQGTEESLEISEDDLSTLHAIFGENAANEIVSLVKQIRRKEERKAREFKPVIVPPISDKETRTQAHHALRRIFPNLLESGMEPDQSIRIKALPPQERKGKKKGRGDRGRGGGQDSGPQRNRGGLGWEELGGEFLHFTLYKENKDTMEVVGFLGSKLGSGAKAFTFAGTKDRRACTAQRVCVKRQTAERMDGFNRTLYNAAIGDFEYCKSDLSLGDLMGNEFVITLRDSHFQGEQGMDFASRKALANNIVSKAIKDFSLGGFINYYGLQRFGSFAASTDTVGLKMLQSDLKGAIDDLLAYSDAALTASNGTDGDSSILVSQDDRNRAKSLDMFRKTGKGTAALEILPRKFSAERNIIQHLSSRNSKSGKHDRKTDWQGALMTIPRNLRLMYVHAYQSLVWNTVAGKRWTTYGNKVVEGDLVLVREHKDKEPQAATVAKEDIDENGEVVINPTGEDSALKDDDQFERARALTAEEASSGKYSIFDVVLPQPGFDVEYPKNEIGKFYEEFMGSEKGGGLDPHNMRRPWREVSLSGGYRKFLARPLQPLEFEIREYVGEKEQFVETDLQKVRRRKGEQDATASNLQSNEEAKDDQDTATQETDGEKKLAVVLKLQLGSSQYATVALRELMKAGGVKAFKPEFMGGR